MKKIILLSFLFCSGKALAQQDTIKPIQHKSASSLHTQTGFHYNPDAGLQYKKGDFQWTTWAYAERLFSPSKYPSWRRVRCKLPQKQYVLKVDKISNFKT